MYLTQTNVINNLTKDEYFQLRELCFFSNCLYNVAIYNIRQQFFQDKTYLTYLKNELECKENENYRLMQSNCAQQTLRVADQAFKSFFALLKLANEGKYDYKKIKMPKYRQKGSLFNYIIQGNSISIRDGYLKIPLSREYMALRGKEKIKIKVPERLIGKKICEVKIIPKYNGRYFKIAYCYEVEVEDFQLNQENTLAIDIGLDNLATCVTNTGTSFIMDGRKIKSINQYWNKQKAKLQGILSKQNLYTSEKMQRITNKRNNRVEDYLKKAARYIVKYCMENDIGTIVCGYNPDFKREIDLGKKTNQQFVQISFGKLRSQLKCLCERYSMKYIEQEESYTSKASFFDLDEIPTYQADCQEKYKFSGRRIHRGLYRSKDGKILNADVNGAANILRKSKQNFKYEELCRGVFLVGTHSVIFKNKLCLPDKRTTPLRIRLSC